MIDHLIRYELMTKLYQSLNSHCFSLTCEGKMCGGAQRTPTGIKHISAAFASSMTRGARSVSAGSSSTLFALTASVAAQRQGTRMRGVPRWRSHRSGSTYSFVAWALGENSSGEKTDGRGQRREARN